MFQISLKAARVNANMTLETASKKAHVSIQTLNKWERGHVIPDYASLHLLSDIYGIPMEYINLPSNSTKVETW